VATPIRLDFTPPSEPDLTALHVEESDSETGPFVEIEVITAIGAYPDYISFATVDATLPTDWFRIRWANAGGAFTPYSEAIQGGTTTLVQMIVDRAMMRNPTADERVVTQAAEQIISSVMKVANPYDVSLTANYSQLEGMTLLVLVRTAISTLAAGGNASSFTAGLISMKQDTGSMQENALKLMMDEAGRLLGIGKTRIGQLAAPVLAQGLATVVSEDLSRLIVEIE
jgi:hypothetical protein